MSSAWASGRCLNRWFRVFRDEGAEVRQAALRSLDRCFQEGCISEEVADALELDFRRGDFSIFGEELR